MPVTLVAETSASLRPIPQSSHSVYVDSAVRSERPRRAAKIKKNAHQKLQLAS